MKLLFRFPSLIRPIPSLRYAAHIKPSTYLKLVERKQYTTSTVDDNMGKDKEKVNFQLKVPKGTKDWQGTDMVIRDKIFGSITEVFKRHGAVTIDTLVCPPMLSHKRAMLTCCTQSGV